METNPNFDDIRSYRDADIKGAVDRLFADAQFARTVHKVLPWLPLSLLRFFLSRFKTIEGFQRWISIKAISRIVMPTLKSLTVTGIDKVNRGQGYVFMTNHRDIVLDTLLLQVLFYRHHKQLSEIGIGDNLFASAWIEEFVRLNRAFVVRRGLSTRQVLESSMHLSAYLWDTIVHRKQPIWIAQREGRCKDSNDKTQESVLKMLAMRGDGDFLHNIKKMRIMPVAISYEYDPCDYLKAAEFQLKRDNPAYKKSKRDDVLSMQTGIVTYKGRVHYQFGSLIDDHIDQWATLTKNEQATQVAHWVDEQIYRNYKFYPINYVALDLLYHNSEQSIHYSSHDQKEVEEYLSQQLDKINIPNKDVEFLMRKLLEMYANPLINHLRILK